MKIKLSILSLFLFSNLAFALPVHLALKSSSHGDIHYDIQKIDQKTKIGDLILHQQEDSHIQILWIEINDDGGSLLEAVYDTTALNVAH